MCNINDKIGVKAFDLILEKQRIRSGPVACFHDDELIKLCTLMLESEQVIIHLSFFAGDLVPRTYLEGGFRGEKDSFKDKVGN